jgi:hypothetical protein
MKIFLSIIFLFFLNSSQLVFSQTISDTTKMNKQVIVKMKNGDEFKGVILKQDANSLVIQTDNGELNLIAKNVTSIEVDQYLGKFKFPNPHDTRYFFGPTGIPIKDKKGYYQNVLLTTNFVNYGITKNISIGGGFEFISTILRNPIWFLTPKIGFDVSNNVHVAGGVLVAGFVGEGSATLGYGVFTYGNSETNLSLGIGYGFMSGELSQNPAIMISGTHRLSNGIALLSENYIIPNVGFLGIQGIRIMSNKNSFDIGAIIIPQIMDFIPALPFVGYSRSF